MPTANGNPGKFCATLVRTSTPAFAALSADRLVQRCPDIALRYAPSATSQWRESLASRLGYLAAALESGRPAMFIDQAVWARTAHAARGGEACAADLKAALQCLDEVIREELPAGMGAIASDYVRQAVAALDAPPAAAANGAAVGDAKASTTPPASTPSPLSPLAGAYLQAILRGDRAAAAHLVLDAAVKGGTPVRDLYQHVLCPVLTELGRMWHMNETSIGTEHFATATTQLAISMLYPHLDRAPSNGRVFVAGSVEGNAHDLGLRMVADVLELDGWRSVYLGPSVPPDDLAEAAAAFKADLIGLSATIATHLPAVGATIRAIRARAAPGSPPRILVGGSGFAATGHDPAAVARELGADAYAGTLDEASRAAKLLGG